MQSLFKKLNELELIKQSIKKEYDIIPANLEKNCSLQKLEKIREDLNTLKEIVQFATNPRKRQPPIINSNNTINVCISFKK